MSIVFQNEYDIIRSGVQRMKILFNEAPISLPDESLCEHNDRLCPIYLGVNSVNHTFITPTIPGKVDMKIGWFSDNNTPLLCVHQVFDIDAR